MKILKEIFNNQFQIKKLSILKVILIFILIQILTLIIGFFPAGFIIINYPDSYLPLALIASISFLIAIFLTLLLFKEKKQIFMILIQML